MMAPLARPRRAQRQEVAQGGDEIAPTVDVGVAAVVGGHALDLRHGRQLRVQDRQIGLPGAAASPIPLLPPVMRMFLSVSLPIVVNPLD